MTKKGGKPKPKEIELKEDSDAPKGASNKIVDTDVALSARPLNGTGDDENKAEVPATSINAEGSDKEKEEKVKETPPEKVTPKVSEATKSVVSNLLKKNLQKGEEIEGEGDDQEAGDKGKVDGNPYASSYYNNAGLGGIGKGYGLNGRNLQTNGKVVQDCNQEGTVVVRITVNPQGEVVRAEPGVKGSTNTHPCLMDPAKKTALLHKWYPDSQAPEQQIGFVVIQFKLGE